MQEEILIAGSGGQGILAFGRVLAQAALEEGKFVTFYPSYGAEIRGGYANCTVIISDSEIASPTISKVKSLITMNMLSFVKFLPNLLREGLLLVNSSLINLSKELETIKAQLIRTVEIPASQIALKLGDIRCANMVMLGVYTEIKKYISPENVAKAIKNIFAKHSETLNLNLKAFYEGFKLEQISTTKSKIV